jgi:hypothetical protein
VADRTLLVLIWCFWIYFTVWLEQIIAKAKNYVTSGEEQWTFGQMLAIATLLGPLFEFCSLMRKWWYSPGDPEAEDKKSEEEAAVEQANRLDEELGRPRGCNCACECGNGGIDLEKGMAEAHEGPVKESSLKDLSIKEKESPVKEGSVKDLSIKTEGTVMDGSSNQSPAKDS